jgi:bifunctional DNA-binding transcriptional regulator/antitoxin component of YhaV-PrlF toxin-antitoxin module
MEKIISIDAVGRTVLPKDIREAVDLGRGGPARIRLVPGGKIEIQPLATEGRTLKKVGKFLVSVTGEKPRHDAAADVRAEREAR